jgi:4-hydroxy-tetrahydrodipicolinate reductase
MGRTLVACISESRELKLTGALTEPKHESLGRDAGEVAGRSPVGVPVTDDRKQALDGAQVAIDFTLPEALEANVRACDMAGAALVVGTTGLTEQHHRTMRKAAHHVPLVYARNMSVGVNLFIDLIARAARALGSEYDVEILEAHHRQKIDAPSGTAQALGEAVATARGGNRLKDVAVYTREGQIGPRVPGTIGFSAIRGGTIVGDHTVLFIGPEEQLEFKHHALDRATFARGALRAAQWVAGRAPGFYTMADVLGLSETK